MNVTTAKTRKKKPYQSQQEPMWENVFHGKNNAQMKCLEKKFCLYRILEMEQSVYALT